MKRTTLIAAIAMALFGAPGAAPAQDASVDAYGGKGEEVIGVSENQPGGNGGVNGVDDSAGNRGGTESSSAPVAQVTATRSAPTGSLPFTGLDLALIAFGGALLIGIGIGARRLSRPIVS